MILEEVEMKAVSTVMMVVLLLAVAGCGQQEKSAEDTKEPSASQTAQAPDVDLHTATATGNLEAIRKHIEAGSDLNVRDPEGGACPLSTAALFGQTEAASALIEAGADINCIGNDGATPLEAVSAPFEAVKPVYEHFAKTLAPMGVKLDLEQIEKIRPQIAEMLK